MADSTGAGGGPVPPAAGGGPRGVFPRRRLKRIEPIAIAGVMTREVINFGSYWRSATFSSTVEPTVYLLAFGLGLGTVLKHVAGYDYLDFVATGTVATAVLFTSAFSAMFGSFVKREFQRTYDAILAAPVDVEELVTAEVVWLALRAGVFGCAPLIVGIVFGLSPSWTIFLVPFIAALTGFGFASLGTFIAAAVKSIDNFSYVTSALLTPMMLVAGTFFPITSLPQWARIASEFNPLHHCVELVRSAAFNTFEATDLLRIGALVLFGAIAWRAAVVRTRARLIE
jgi:lipooligosaccharide transport system permease protein